MENTDTKLRVVALMVDNDLEPLRIAEYEDNREISFSPPKSALFPSCSLAVWYYQESTQPCFPENIPFMSLEAPGLLTYFFNAPSHEDKKGVNTSTLTFLIPYSPPKPLVVVINWGFWGARSTCFNDRLRVGPDSSMEVRRGSRFGNR